MTLPASGPGRLLEPRSDAWPRGMIAPDKTRLIGRLRHFWSESGNEERERGTGNGGSPGADYPDSPIPCSPFPVPAVVPPYNAFRGAPDNSAANFAAVDGGRCSPSLA